MEELMRTVFKQALGVELPDPFPVMTLRRGDGALRFGQAGPARAARIHRTHRRHEGRRVQGVLRRGQRRRRPRRRRCAFPAAARSRAARSTPTPSSSASTAPRASPTSRSTTSRRGREGLQSPIVKNLSDAALDAIVERSGAKDGDLIFFGADKAKIVNDALGALRVKVGHEKGFARAGLEAAVGGRLPDVRIRRGSQALGRHAPSVHRAQGRARGLSRDRSGARPSPRPTTWC